MLALPRCTQAAEPPSPEHGEHSAYEPRCLA